MNFKLTWPAKGHRITEEDFAGVSALAHSSEQLTNGANVKRFEQNFSDKFNLGTCLASMSCAHALDLVALYVASKSDGDFEVLIPSHTYCATAIAFGRVGAGIKWVDIDPKHLSVSLKSVKENITTKTKALVVVHLYGLVCPEILEIRDFCKEKDIILIEDCAQCLGAKLNGTYAGGFGDFATFSFHAQKNLTTLGEGGMIAMRDKRLVEIFSGLRLNGHQPFSAREKQAYWLPAMTNVSQDLPGYWPMKSTMTEIQGIVGCNLLLRLDEMNLRRKKIASGIVESLIDLSSIEFQALQNSESHSNHLLPARIISKKFTRDDFIKHISSEYGIQCIVQYYPLHRYDLFKDKGFGNADVPHTNAFFDNMVSFPFWEGLSKEEALHITSSIRKTIMTLSK